MMLNMFVKMVWIAKDFCSRGVQFKFWPFYKFLFEILPYYNKEFFNIINKVQDKLI